MTTHLVMPAQFSHVLGQAFCFDICIIRGSFSGFFFTLTGTKSQNPDNGHLTTNFPWHRKWCICTYGGGILRRGWFGVVWGLDW